MDVCVFTDEISHDFDEALAQARAAGADTVEIRAGLYGHDVTTVTDADIARIRKGLEKHGLRVSAIGSPVGKCSFENETEGVRHRSLIPRLIALGAELDCRLIRCFAFWNPAGRIPPAREVLPEYLNRIAPLLKPMVRELGDGGCQFGLELAAETLVATSGEVLALASALDDDPAFRVVWDIPAEWAAGESPYPTGYERLKDRIVHVHIKPNKDISMATIPDSDLAYSTILAAMRADGYNGAISIEHWGSPAGMISGVRQLRACVDSIG